MNKTNWEEEFDDLFLREMYQDDGYSEERAVLKSFIRTHFIPKDELREEIIGEMEVAASREEAIKVPVDLGNRYRKHD